MRTLVIEIVDGCAETVDQRAETMPAADLSVILRVAGLHNLESRLGPRLDPTGCEPCCHARTGRVHVLFSFSNIYFIPASA